MGMNTQMKNDIRAIARGVIANLLVLALLAVGTWIYNQIRGGALIEMFGGASASTVQALSDQAAGLGASLAEVREEVRADSSSGSAPEDGVILTVTRPTFGRFPGSTIRISFINQSDTPVIFERGATLYVDDAPHPVRLFSQVGGSNSEQTIGQRDSADIGLAHIIHEVENQSPTGLA